ncbi:MAG TPA: carbohydrate ABC transporter permease [Tepiditoga sp.]|nr:carbohydrate ABC transporter permease [Thermotogota bacterium]HOO75172.1 carbohydrate ABC transporter permease [Tepiditoga sp.]
MNKRTSGKNFTKYLILILISMIFLFPFLFLISTSLKSMDEAFSNSFHLIPQTIHWDNYIKAFQKIPFLTYTKNTVVITLINVIGQLIVCPMIAYGLSKIEWIGKKIIFGIILATMLIPYQVTMIPVYMIWNKLNLVGTIIPITLPAFFGNAFYIIILTQFFKTIPNSILEAAKIDGASEFRIYSKIVLPLCKPALATVAIFTFLNTWSDFLGPLLYLTEQKSWTLSIGLQQYMSAHYVEWTLLMAASAMFTIPIVILFFFAQKKFVEGIVTTGLKD